MVPNFVLLRSVALVEFDSSIGCGGVFSDRHQLFFGVIKMNMR